MLLITSSTILIALSISLITTSSPLTMGLWIILTALTSSWFISMMFNSWFGLITFLIYVGGMLVMFAYFVALTPNQPMGLTSSMLTLLFTSITVLTLMYSPYVSSPHQISTSLPFMHSPITIMFSPMNSILLLLLVVILFLIMVAVVKIVNMNSGPLRPFF
uniref:NADH dehydrogenase subunit 6 n=1 Tax=Lepidonotopodium sp. YZ-2018 TaxID=2153333 RepID=A0A343W679_9ANNE|nr:NADH dehydrogenase subunit 6 [Lepidonotopodium sp. YZ-2018]